MARTGLHSKDARRYVRIAQLAGVGLGVMAVAMWATDAGMTKALPPRPQPEKGFDTAQGPKIAPRVPTIEADAPLGMQDRLDLAAKHNKPTEAQSKPDLPAQTPPPPQPTGPEWRYLGQIKEPDRTLALVSIDGGQKFIPRGATVEISTPGAEGRPGSEYKAKVLGVEPEYISIKEGNAEPRRIALEARTAHVSWVKNMPMAVASASVPGALSPEARARLTAGQIDPAQVERARLALQQATQNNRNRAAASTPAANANAAGQPLTPGVVPNTGFTGSGGQIINTPGQGGSDTAGNGAADLQKIVPKAKGAKPASDAEGEI